jgi:hypothetical protein
MKKLREFPKPDPATVSGVKVCRESPGQGDLDARRTMVSTRRTFPTKVPERVARLLMVVPRLAPALPLRTFQESRS